MFPNNKFIFKYSGNFFFFKISLSSFVISFLFFMNFRHLGEEEAKKIEEKQYKTENFLLPFYSFHLNNNFP